ncbi:MAG: hypothetical protein ACE5NW_18280 [Acidiferrobacterales bacterium]
MHFAVKENVVHERNYGQYEDQKTEHKCLLDEIRDIMDDYE